MSTLPINEVGLPLSKEAVIRLIQLHQERFKALGIIKIALFGSFVRGEQRPDSDIDLLVDFDPEQKTFDNFIDAVYYLEEILGREVELITRESLSPYIGPHILAELEDVPFAA